MEIKRKAVTGNNEKGDIRVSVEPSSGGLTVNISSIEGESAYSRIAETINAIINMYGIINAKFDILDNSAAEFVVKARVESAIMKASQEMEKKYYMEKPYYKYRLRRSCVLITGNNPYLMSNIVKYNPDCIIFDLESTVSIKEKDSARILVKNALQSIDFGSSEKMVRINTLDICGNEDIEEILQSEPDGILIPKCESEYDVKKVADIIEKTEKKYQMKHNYVKIIPIIESAKGIEKSYEIANSNDRVIMLALGADNYAASLGIRVTDREYELDHARKTLINAAKSFSKQALDCIYSGTEDIEGFKKICRRIKAMGFDGKLLSNPSHINIIHDIFSPHPEELNIAKEIVALYKETKDQGTGIMQYNNIMIDMHTVMKAIKIVEMSRLRMNIKNNIKPDSEHHNTGSNTEDKPINKNKFNTIPETNDHSANNETINNNNNNNNNSNQ